MQRLLPVGTRVQLSDVKQFYICGYLSGSKEHNIEYIYMTFPDGGRRIRTGHLQIESLLSLPV